MSKDNGESAFPIAGTGAFGMSLRDWLAGQALPAVISAVCDGCFSDERSPEGIASIAYKIADAMLAESKKEAG